MTNQSSDSEIFCPGERIKELELRTQRRNNFEEGLFKDRFPTEEELVYHKELLGEPQPPFSTLEPKIRRGDPWSLKIPYLGSIIDSGLSEVVLGQPFARTSKLTHDESLGLIRFAQRDDEVVFRMPQRTKELDRISPFEKDKFEAFFVDSLKEIENGLLEEVDWFEQDISGGNEDKKLVMVNEGGRMRDENPIRNLGDYSKPSHEGHRNTIELLAGNNVVPLRSDTIRLGKNGCSFHGLRSEDLNQHLKDFLKPVDLLDLDG
ncbi:hypothetical protein Tco_0779509 [Tanacetum coccineum]